MRLCIMGIFVDDQKKARAFYVDKLGFAGRQDIRIGKSRLLTLVSPEQPDGTLLRLDLVDRPADAAFQAARFTDGIIAAIFEVHDVAAEARRLRDLGVRFTIEPWGLPPHSAVFDDTCGNLIALHQRTNDGYTMWYMRLGVADGSPDDGNPLPGNA